MDRFGDIVCEHLDNDVRQMAYNWEPGVARTERDASGAWLGEWSRAEDPEQYRYGRNWTIDSAVRPKYDDIQRYQSAGGVMSLAR
jgi:hypothetical protein